MDYPWVAVAYSFLGLGIITWIGAIKQDYKWYWLAAVCLYIFSFLGSFTIGILTLAFTFIFCMLALGHALNQINNPYHSAIYLV